MKRIFFFFALTLLFASCRTCQIGNNPASVLKSEQQAQGLHLSETTDTTLSGLFYHLDYQNDYYLDKILRADVRSLKGFISFAARHFFNTGKLIANHNKLIPGCTAFTCTAPNGDILYARNFDFTSAGPVPVILTTTTPKDGYKSLSLLSMTMFNYPQGSLNDGKTDVSLLAVAPYILMDGINAKGLAISVLYLDLKDTVTGRYVGCTQQYDRSKHDIMTTSTMRLVLDRAATVEEAIAMLQQYNMFANGKKADGSYHFLLADTTGASVVLEYAPLNGTWTMSPLNVPHNLVTNFYLHPDFYSIGHGHNRYNKALHVLDKNNDVLSEEEAMQLLAEVSQLPTKAKTSNTQWSVVYNLTQRRYTICIGRNYQHPIQGGIL